MLVAVLKNPAPYYGQHLRPTGPKSLSMQDMAAVISRVMGKKIRVIPAPEWLFLKAACYIGRDYGFNKFTISQARLYNREFQANKFDVGGPTGVVQRVAGKAPDDFETIVRRLHWRVVLRDAQRQRLVHGLTEVYGRAATVRTQPKGAGATESVTEEFRLGKGVGGGNYYHSLNRTYAPSPSRIKANPPSPIPKTTTQISKGFTQPLRG